MLPFSNRPKAGKKAFGIFHDLLLRRRYLHISSLFIMEFLLLRPGGPFARSKPATRQVYEVI